MLVTQNYKALNRELHESIPEYGGNGHLWASMIDDIAVSIKTRDVLDYGCGKESLKSRLSYVKGYDPCIPGLDETPAPADFVVCTDVLEHIEPECIEDVLNDIKRVTKRLVFAVIESRPAMKTLPDGRNAHLIQEPPEWWLPKFFNRFTVQEFKRIGGKFFVIATATPTD